MLVHDKTPMKGKYLLAVVEAVNPGKDGLVRSCKVGYGIPKETGDITKYEGRRWVTITCSVQRLTLLLAVEEQDIPLTVEGGNVVNKFTSEDESVVKDKSVKAEEVPANVADVPVMVIDEVPANMVDVPVVVRNGIPANMVDVPVMEENRSIETPRRSKRSRRKKL